MPKGEPLPPKVVNRPEFIYAPGGGDRPLLSRDMERLVAWESTSTDKLQKRFADVLATGDPDSLGKLDLADAVELFGLVEPYSFPKGTGQFTVGLRTRWDVDNRGKDGQTIKVVDLPTHGQHIVIYRGGLMEASTEVIGQVRSAHRGGLVALVPHQPIRIVQLADSAHIRINSDSETFYAGITVNQLEPNFTLSVWEQKDGEFASFSTTLSYLGEPIPEVVAAVNIMKAAENGSATDPKIARATYSQALSDTRRYLRERYPSELDISSQQLKK